MPFYINILLDRTLEDLGKIRSMVDVSRAAAAAAKNVNLLLQTSSLGADYLLKTLERAVPLRAKEAGIQLRLVRRCQMDRLLVMLAIIDRVDMDAMAAYAEARGSSAAGCLDCVARAGRLCGCDGCDNGGTSAVVERVLQSQIKESVVKEWLGPGRRPL